MSRNMQVVPFVDTQTIVTAARRHCHSSFIICKALTEASLRLNSTLTAAATALLSP